MVSSAHPGERTRGPRRLLRRLGRMMAAGGVMVVAISGGVTPAGAASTDNPETPTNPPVRSCTSLLSLSLPNTTVDSATVDGGDESTPRSCRVHLSVAHPPAGDDVNIDVWLPIDSWNGRFRGTGGGGFAGGSTSSLLPPLRAGYATASTDAGHVGGDASFALNPDGTLNWQRIRDFGYLGIHDMTVTAKAVIRAYYGTPPRYSYFTGCSTGGRQGIMEAQRYPADYHGILAGSPAINWTKFQIAQIWGQLVMLESDNFIPGCKFETATTAAIRACDGHDGVEDGVIGEATRCEYDPAELVGTSTECGTITKADAEVIRRIWEGARTRDGQFLWYGLPRGASFAGLHDTEVVDGELVGRPFPFVVDWIRYFLLQDPQWDWTTLSYAQFERLFELSVEWYDSVLSTDDPDLRAFRDAGGKLLMWHGFADFGIFPQGTIDYYERVVDLMGGRAKTKRFARLFMAPGVDHCGGGTGPAPTGQFEALVRWVERHKAPRTLDAVRRDADGDVTLSRPLCPYPKVARYKGHGDTTDADNFKCKKDYGSPRPVTGEVRAAR